MPYHQHKLKPRAKRSKKKKKARLAYFASLSKIDQLEEEEKRKARAIRFAKPPPSSLPQANGKGDIEPKETVAVKLLDRPEWLLGSLVVGNFIV